MFLFTLVSKHKYRCVIVVGILGGKKKSWTGSEEDQMKEFKKKKKQLTQDIKLQD